jgi:hypothetical protein
MCVFSELVCSWISVIFANAMWHLLFPVQDCTEDRLSNMACTVYWCEMSEIICSHMDWPSSFDDLSVVTDQSQHMINFL